MRCRFIESKNSQHDLILHRLTGIIPQRTALECQKFYADSTVHSLFRTHCGSRADQRRFRISIWAYVDVNGCDSAAETTVDEQRTLSAARARATLLHMQFPCTACQRSHRRRIGRRTRRLCPHMYTDINIRQPRREHSFRLPGTACLCTPDRR